MIYQLRKQIKSVRIVTLASKPDPDSKPYF